MSSVSKKPQHPKLDALLQLWREHRWEDQLPAAADFDPLMLRPWAGNLVILDIGRDDEFVYAYYGDAFAAAFGGDQVGQPISALPAPQRNILKDEYERARTQRVPLSRIYTADFGKGFASWERLVLPLASDGKTVDKLMVAAFELPRDAQRR